MKPTIRVLLLKIAGYFFFPGLVFLAGTSMGKGPAGFKFLLNNRPSSLALGLAISLIYAAFLTTYVYVYEHRRDLDQRSLFAEKLRLVAAVITTFMYAIGILLIFQHAGDNAQLVVTAVVAITCFSTWYIFSIFGLAAESLENPDAERKLFLARNKYVAFTILVACVPFALGLMTVYKHPILVFYGMLILSFLALMLWFIRKSTWMFATGALGLIALFFLVFISMFNQPPWLQIAKLLGFGVYLGLYLGTLDALRHLAETDFPNNEVYLLHLKNITAIAVIFLSVAPLISYMYPISSFFTFSAVFFGAIVYITLLRWPDDHDHVSSRLIGLTRWSRRIVPYLLVLAAIGFSQPWPWDHRIEVWAHENSTIIQTVALGSMGLIGQVVNRARDNIVALFVPLATLGITAALWGVSLFFVVGPRFRVLLASYALINITLFVADTYFGNPDGGWKKIIKQLGLSREQRKKQILT